MVVARRVQFDDHSPQYGRRKVQSVVVESSHFDDRPSCRRVLTNLQERQWTGGTQLPEFRFAAAETLVVFPTRRAAMGDALPQLRTDGHELRHRHHPRQRDLAAHLHGTQKYRLCGTCRPQPRGPFPVLLKFARVASRQPGEVREVVDVVQRSQQLPGLGRHLAGCAGGGPPRGGLDVPQRPVDLRNHRVLDASAVAVLRSSAILLDDLRQVPRRACRASLSQRDLWPARLHLGHGGSDLRMHLPPYSLQLPFDSRVPLRPRVRVMRFSEPSAIGVSRRHVPSCRHKDHRIGVLPPSIRRPRSYRGVMKVFSCGRRASRRVWGGRPRGSPLRARGAARNTNRDRSWQAVAPRVWAEH